MKLADIIPKESVKIELSGKTKDDIIKELVVLLAESSHVIDMEQVSRSIFERERTMSTGIGNGAYGSGSPCDRIRPGNAWAGLAGGTGGQRPAGVCRSGLQKR